jgi:hypothetical protein
MIHPPCPLPPEQWPETIPVDDVLKYLVLDPASPTGLRWRRDTLNSRVKRGDIAGNWQEARQRWMVSVAGFHIQAAKLVLLMNGYAQPSPKHCVAYADRNPSNVGISNLSWVTRGESVRRAMPNKNGFPFVRATPSGKFQAQCKVEEKGGSRRLTTASYPTPREAYNAMVQLLDSEPNLNHRIPAPIEQW